MPFTYKQLEKALWKAAHIYAHKSEHRYEPAELVNEVWSMGRIQRLSTIEFAFQRACLDIIDYMRSQEGREYYYKVRKPTYKKKAKVSSYNTLNAEGSELINVIESNDYSVFSKIASEDERKFLFSRVTNNATERLILNMRYEEFTLIEIANVIGITESRVSQIFMGLAQELAKYINNNSEILNECQFMIVPKKFVVGRSVCRHYG